MRNRERLNPRASARNFGVLHSSALLVLSLYLLSPLAYQAWIGGWRGMRDVLFAFNLLTSLLWLALAHFVAQRPLVMHLLLAPLYLTTAVDLFLCATFGARLSSGYVNIALTDHADAMEFLSAYTLPVAVAAGVLILVYLPCLCVLRHLRKPRSPRLALAMGMLLVAIYGLAVGRSIWAGNTTERAVLDLVAHENGAPMGALAQSALALKLHSESSALRAQRRHFSFGATKAPSAEEEIYVWVVGESARPTNWSMFGYARDTTPLLRAMPGIIALPNMLTTAPHTAVAVPSMLSLRPITDWSSVQAESSIVSAFNEAGFKTYWLSMQDADSWSGIIPQVAAEARRRRYFDRGFDGTLLAEFRQILRDAPRGGHLLIVLHTKGSHFDYARRYPTEFAKFTTPGGTRRDAVVDAYDNSILYTDWFLSEVISSLASRKTQSTLFYASDHGENLLDDEKQLLGHALGNAYDLNTAAFVWLSDAARLAHPEKVMNAERHRTEMLSLSNLPHTMLDLAGISAKGFDAGMSLVAPGFVSRPRSYIVRGALRHEQAASSAR